MIDLVENTNSGGRGLELITLREHLQKLGFGDEMLDQSCEHARLGVDSFTREACFEPLNKALRVGYYKQLLITDVMAWGMRVQFAKSILEETLEHSPKWFTAMVRLWDFVTRANSLKNPVFYGWLRGASHNRTITDFPFDQLLTVRGTVGFGDRQYEQDDGTIWLIAHGALSSVQHIKILYEGEGPSYCSEESNFRWVKEAAESGNASAMLLVGQFFERGTGVPQDDALAMEWFHKAAHSGNSEACFRIALCHELGRGLPLDLIQAYLWYSAGATKSRLADGFFAKERERLASTMTPEQLAEGQRLAREWFEKHSK